MPFKRLSRLADYLLIHEQCSRSSELPFPTQYATVRCLCCDLVTGIGDSLIYLVYHIALYIHTGVTRTVLCGLPFKLIWTGVKDSFLGSRRISFFLFSVGFVGHNYNNNNNKIIIAIWSLFMPPHVVRARGAYKGLQMRAFHHTIRVFWVEVWRAETASLPGVFLSILGSCRVQETYNRSQWTCCAHIWRNCVYVRNNSSRNWSI